MRIWIVATGEPWPTDEGRPRLLRGGILANHCAARGDEVTWWNTTFDHRRREDRFGRDLVHENVSGVTMRGLYAPTPYTRSVSLGRIVNHIQVGRAFRRQVADLEPPDVILACMPLVELAYEAVRYGRRNGVPVVVDLRDFWPDVWLEPIPRVLHPLARVPLAPWTWMLQRALGNSDAISGITESFLRWGLAKARRARREADFVVPLAYDPERASPDELKAAHAYWDGLGVPSDGTFIACYFGTLANRTGVELIVEAARAIPVERRQHVRFVIAGVGDAYESLRERAGGLDHVLFPGWVDLPRIAALKARASVGMIAYPNTPDFVASVPNKVPEYLAGGLAVVSTLEGEVRSMLEREQAGVHVTPRTPEALAETLLSLAEDPQRIAKLKAGAREASQAYASADIYERFRGHLQAISKLAG
ncbi:MAG: glycosyltransferase family 4 protein [Brevundimonas sp.]|nr:glycosyltransferase family 4 protein [Brevundimonas sp.]